MSIATTDLIAYGSASRPTDDVSTTGGAIDTQNRPVFTQLSTGAKGAFISDGADTRSVDITGRDSTGAPLAETITMNGVVEVLTVGTYERFLTIKAQSTDASRTITVKQGSGGSTVATIPPNEAGFFALFINSASAASPLTRYEKTFWKNTHGTLTLTAALARLSADPSAKIKTGICAAKNDTTTIANRLAAPAGVSFVDDNVDQSVPGTILEAGSRIGIWWEQDLDTNNAPVRSTFTMQLSGSSV